MKFYLPNKRDGLQQQIILKGNFYEELELRKFKNFLGRNLGIVLDVGANIGNHTIYFSKIMSAKKVYSFEPQKEAFDILKKNIQLNNLESKNVLFNIGLSDASGKAEIENPYVRDLGSRAIRKSKDGEIILNSLDNLNIKERIDFIKIDVEGFEENVLKGATKTIKKDKPLIWIEIWEERESSVFKLLSDMGYYEIINLGGNKIMKYRESKKI